MFTKNYQKKSLLAMFAQLFVISGDRNSECSGGNKVIWENVALAHVYVTGMKV